MPDIMEHILKRRSIRSFTAQEVEPDRITQLLEAAMAAPSATNARPWEFVVITAPSKLKEMEDNLPFGRQGAPLMIAVLSNCAIATGRAAEKFWVQDCSAAAENILLAATGMGLGCCWVGVYPLEKLVGRVSAVLHLPQGVIPLCVINLGYPAETKPARTQYDPGRVHMQSYDSVQGERYRASAITRTAAFWSVGVDYLKSLVGSKNRPGSGKN
jgi:nitroreductase